MWIWSKNEILKFGRCCDVFYSKPQLGVLLGRSFFLTAQKSFNTNVNSWIFFALWNRAPNKFCENHPGSFWLILQTDRRTNQRQHKLSRLGGGAKYSSDSKTLSYTCTGRAMMSGIGLNFDLSLVFVLWSLSLMLCRPSSSPSDMANTANTERAGWETTLACRQWKHSPLHRLFDVHYQRPFSSSPPWTKDYYCFCCCYWYCFPPL